MPAGRPRYLLHATLVVRASEADKKAWPPPWASSMVCLRVAIRQLPPSRQRGAEAVGQVLRSVSPSVRPFAHHHLFAPLLPIGQFGGADAAARPRKRKLEIGTILTQNATVFGPRGLSLGVEPFARRVTSQSSRDEDPRRRDLPLRLPVQHTSRPRQEFRRLLCVVELKGPPVRAWLHRLDRGPHIVRQLVDGIVLRQDSPDVGSCMHRQPLQGFLPAHDGQAFGRFPLHPAGQSFASSAYAASARSSFSTSSRVWLLRMMIVSG